MALQFAYTIYYCKKKGNKSGRFLGLFDRTKSMNVLRTSRILQNPVQLDELCA